MPRNAIALTMSVLLALSTAQAADGPVGVWHFDESSGSAALDASQKENDGRLIGGVARVQGKFGKALQFDGKDGCVEMAGVGKLPCGAVEAWVRFDRMPSGQVGVASFCAGDKGKSDAALLGFIGYPTGSDPAAFSLSVCPGDWIVAKGQAKPEIGPWYHLAGVWDGNGMRCYVNGVVEAEQPEWKGGLPSHAAILIGAGSWGQYLACAVDEVRVYARALTAEEVRSHFEAPAYAADPPQPTARDGRPAKEAVRSLADFYDAGSPTCGIQEAIEALPMRGGMVSIPPGVYLLKRAIVVPSRVSLCGAGASTVLRKCPQAQTKIAEAAPKGSMVLKVAEAKGLERGMQVCVTCRPKLGGWYCSQPILLGIEGNALRLSEPLKEVYDPAAALVINYFPAIWIEGRRDVTVADLVIDGAIPDNPGPLTDFVCEAIHCVFSEGVRIRNCIVRDWPCDGIGIQGGCNVLVTGCEVSGCRGNGFHPGTSLHHATFSGNSSHHNAWDGLYFCMNVRYIHVTDNVFYQNGRHGIGGLGGGEMSGRDQYNVVANNVCESNAQCGIEVTQGNHNIVSGNVCRNNSQANPGQWPGLLVQDSEDITVTSNLCTDENPPGKKTQAHGIAETGKSENNIITSNNCRDNAKAGVITVGKKTVRSDNLE